MAKTMQCEWTARRGALGAARGGVHVFTEDSEMALQGVYAIVNAPAASDGIGLRIRLRAVRRPSCEIWLRRMGEDGIAKAVFDFEAGGAVLDQTRTPGTRARAEIAEVEPGAYDLWFSLCEPPCARGYRIDLLSRRDLDGSAKYSGDGRPAFRIEDARVGVPEGGLLQLYARANGFSAEAELATVPDYYAAFFTAEKFNRALSRETAAEQRTSRWFDQLLAESDPPARLSLADISSKYLTAGDAGALRLEMTSDELAAKLGDPAFRRKLRDVGELRAAIITRFPSDAGVDALRATLAVELESGVGKRSEEMLRRSPRLLGAALFSAAGLYGANRYLAPLGANRFCFDPMVLTRLYTEDVGAPMTRNGLALLSLRRMAVAP
jgi:hypothetical protein